MIYQCACLAEFPDDPDAYLDHTAECPVVQDM